MNEDAFRRYLKAKVERAGSVDRLACMIGEHRPSLSKMVHGKRPPSKKVLAYLGLVPAYEFERLPKLPGLDE